MNTAIDNLAAAQAHAMGVRPRVGGFPVLAEVLRRAGVRRNEWFLPSAQSVYVTAIGTVVQQGEPLVRGLVDVPAFDRDALVRALRADQAGETLFPEFLQGAWQAGVVRYVVDFDERLVRYYGCGDESYVESYPEVAIDAPSS